MRNYREEWAEGEIEARGLLDVIDALRTKIEQMEKQEPVAWCATDETGTVIEALGMNQSRRFDTALYLAPGAQPVPSDVRKVVRGFRWDSEAQCHIPTLEVEFDPVPAGHPTDAKGWQDQGRLAAWLCGIPGAQLAPTCAACDG